MRTKQTTEGRAVLLSDLAAGLSSEARRYLRDKLKAAAAGRDDVFIGSRRAYLLSEAAEVIEQSGEKIATKYGAAVITALRANIDAAKLENTEAAEDVSEGPTKDQSDEVKELKTKLKAALQNNVEIRRAERRAAAALAVSERDKAAALNEVSRLQIKRRSGAEKLRAVFTSPSFLFLPLALIIFASFVHMGIVFSAAFVSSFAAWTMAAVFSLVVLVFTFNSEGRRGAAFAVAFAVLEAIINGVYFDFLPASMVPPCAALALPICLLAYTHLFTAKARA